MDIFLKLKHWQVFILLSSGLFATNFSWENQELLTMVINLIGPVVYFFWYFAVGLELTNLAPRRVELPRVLFIVNGFVIIISVLIINSIFDGHFSGNGFLAFIWIGYLMYAMIQFLLFPGKALRTIELGKEANFVEYIGYSLLSMFWPIGIWILQPKLNQIHQNDN